MRPGAYIDSVSECFSSSQLFEKWLGAHCLSEAELSTRTYKGKLSSARVEFQIAWEKNGTKKQKKLSVPLFCLLQGLNKQAAQTVQWSLSVDAWTQNYLKSPAASLLSVFWFCISTYFYCFNYIYYKCEFLRLYDLNLAVLLLIVL